LRTTVKKWFKDKEYGFLDNGTGPDVFVCKADLEKCHYLRVGVTVEFDCHLNDKGLVAKHVKLVRDNPQPAQRRAHNEGVFGVMT